MNSNTTTYTTVTSKSSSDSKNKSKESDSSVESSTKSSSESSTESSRNQNTKQIHLQNNPTNPIFSKLSEILSFYSDVIRELENELLKLKDKRKQMKIKYINKYLNMKHKLNTEDNIKRQMLKKMIIDNGDEINNLKSKLQTNKDKIIEYLNEIKLQ